MLLVDEILEQDATRIICAKTFHANEYFFQGHYPDQPIVPGIVLCEIGMQAGAVLLAKHTSHMDDKIPVATRLNNVKFKKIVRPGDTVKADVTLTERLADAFFLTAKITCDGKLSARFEFACAIVEME